MMVELGGIGSVEGGGVGWDLIGGMEVIGGGGVEWMVVELWGLWSWGTNVPKQKDDENTKKVSHFLFFRNVFPHIRFSPAYVSLPACVFFHIHFSTCVFSPYASPHTCFFHICFFRMFFPHVYVFFHMCFFPHLFLSKYVSFQIFFFSKNVFFPKFFPAQMSFLQFVFNFFERKVD